MPSPAGNLDWQPLVDRLDLVAPVVAGHAELVPRARAAAIDPALADTAAFYQAYDVAPEGSANCVMVVGRRGGEARYAAVMVLATMRADVNGGEPQGARRPEMLVCAMDEAVAMIGLEYGGSPNGVMPPRAESRCRVRSRADEDRRDSEKPVATRQRRDRRHRQPQGQECQGHRWQAIACDITVRAEGQ